jgi:hypothetical protein
VNLAPRWRIAAAPFKNLFPDISDRFLLSGLVDTFYGGVQPGFVAEYFLGSAILSH